MGKLFTWTELKILWPFYLDMFLGTILFILPPFEILYFNSIGLSASQIGILLASWPLATLLFEIPTGAFADLYGRKASVMMGYFLQGILLVFVFFFTSFKALLVLFFLIGAVATLSSGSYESWVIDLLKRKGQKKLVHDFFAKRRSLYNLAFAISGVLGALFVAKLGLASIWFVSGIAMMISVGFLVFGPEMHERPKIRIKETASMVWNQSKDSIKYSLRHYALFYLLLISFIIGIVGSLDTFISWTPLLKGYGFPDYAFGYLWTVMGLFGVIAPLVSKRFTKLFGEKKVLIATSLLFLAYGLSVVLANSLILLVGLFLFAGFVLDLEAPVWSVYFHRFAPSRMRATITSFSSMMMALAGIISLPIAGILVDSIGGRYTIFIAALLSIPTIILYSMIKEPESVEIKH